MNTGSSIERQMRMKVIQRIKKFILTDKELWICALLGALTFVFIYGVYILNPAYTDWLLTSEDGDLTQHYLGWKFYRHAGWRFPFGWIDTMAYPNRTSVIFTDSIPLFAFVFKMLRFLLPVHFQYFGWFGLMCFMLQGAFGAKLVKKYVKGSFGVVVGGMFFVLSPVFIDRMYWMTSLASHFLCLFGLLFIVYYEEKYNDTKKAAIGWGALGILCAGIHIYFLPMCGIILLGFMLMDLVKGRKKWKVFLPLGSYLAGAAATVFVFGGFGCGMKAGNDGLGYYSFNLNGFFNPHGWSAYLKDMPYTDSQYEGFGYLGLGILILLIFAAAVWLGNAAEQRKMEKQGTVRSARAQQNKINGVVDWTKRHIQGIVWALILLLTLFMAASNVVMYHDKVLYEMPLPKMLFRLWSVFRATGRLIWPAVYLLILGAICMDGKIVNERTKNMLLTICLLFQVLDIKGILTEKNEIYNKVDSYQTLLSSESWRQIGTEGQIKHICFVSDVANSRKLLFSFGDYASDYGLTLSNFYFARSLGDKEAQAREQALAECPADTLFVFFDNEAQRGFAYPMNYYKMDGLIVGSKEPLDGLESITRSELMTYRYDMSSGRFLNNAEVVEDGWNIHPYGNSYGPYLNAQAGSYTVTVQGDGLTAADVKCYYNSGDTNLDPQNLAINENTITFAIELTEYVSDLEIALWNMGSADMQVAELVIEKH